MATTESIACCDADVAVVCGVRKCVVAKCVEREMETFVNKHKICKEMHERAMKSMVAGVPMSWMLRLPGKWPIFVTSGQGAHIIDVDGNNYVDLCLGDTGAMTGHAPQAVVEAAYKRLQNGHAFMLPIEDCAYVSEELGRRFGLPYWQTALTATDANRFALRIARQLTGRSKILVFNYCYHGTVDETFITLSGENKTPACRTGNVGPAFDPVLTTKVIEFNDIPALEKALKDGDVAAVLAEPAMTNIGIILPNEGYHAALREITRRTGTILIIDETHTICAGPGGYTKRFNLQPDMITIGKPIAAGIPASVYGMSTELAAKFLAHNQATKDICDISGVGGTLAGNALSFAAMRATLETVLTAEAFERMEQLAISWTQGVQSVIDEFKLPWVVQRLGCRAEYWFRQSVPHNGSEAAAAVDAELEHYMHLAALNRGILLTPFHNMALMSPATTQADVDAHTAAFRDSVAALMQ